MREEIDAVLGELERAVADARSMPMSASVVVNRAEVLDLIGHLDRAIDTALATATGVVGDREAFVASGQSEANEILRQARLDRDKMVSDSDVYRLGQERAEELMQATRRECDELRSETEGYVEERLAHFEVTLTKTLDGVRRGLSRLNDGPVGELGDDSDVSEMALPDHLERGPGAGGSYPTA